MDTCIQRCLAVPDKLPDSSLTNFRAFSRSHSDRIRLCFHSDQKTKSTLLISDPTPATTRDWGRKSVAGLEEK
jgi:hypothetical protein